MFSFHSFFFSLLPLLFFTAFLLKWLFNGNSSTSHRNLPPSPPKLPIIGNLHQLGLFPHRWLQSQARNYGPLMLLRLGSVPVLVVSSAAAAREVMKTHDVIFSNKPKSSIPSRILYNLKDVAFSPYGEHWRQVRGISVLQLLSSKRVQSYRNVREEETALMIEKIRRSCSSSSSPSSSVNLTDMFVSLTNDIVCRITLGKKYSGGEGGKKFKKLLGTFGELLGTFNIGDYIPWLAWLNRINGLDARVDKLAKEFDQFLEDTIEEHITQNKKKINNGCGSGQGENRQDFVDNLLEIQKENTAGAPIHRDTIKALILGMFAAGTDTTYTVLEWVMAELLRHPKIMKKLQNEVREIGRGKPNITEDDLEKMHYLKAVIKETLRLRTPVPLLVPRESTQDVKVMGYDIAAGTQVLINAWMICRDPLSWKDPEEFRPERFLNNSIDFKGHDFEFIPFGAGRRGCPGMLFAMNINELALANLVHNFEFSLPGGATEDLDMTEAAGITIHKKNPLLLVATTYC